jgi:uncharacterized protein YeaO (DUF488 family)
MMKMDRMKVIIAGSRNVTLPSLLTGAMENCPFEITEVVSGRARGADTLGEQWADTHHVPKKLFPADWEREGKRAGILRNCQMGDYADALIALWDGKSRGTFHMISYMLKQVKPVFVLNTSIGAWQLRRGGGKLMTLARAQIGTGWPGVDVTAKSAQGPAKEFAPPWELVRMHQSREIDNAEYTRLYRLALQAIPQASWKWLTGQAIDDVLTVQCYCPDTTQDGAPKFCHTHVMIDYMLTRWPAYFHDGR